MRRTRRIACILACLLACRGSSPSAQAIGQHQLEALVDSLVPPVSKAAGLAFKSTPRSAVRSREQIRAYLVAKMQRELPAARLEGISDAYRLLGMISDSVDLRQLFLELYTEQIVGFYDPDSTALFAVAGGDPTQLRLVLAHELVHALQHQYLPLDSILHDSTDSDAQAAAQAVLEGQATLVSLAVLVPGMDLQTNDTFWTTFREQLRAQQSGTTVYARAPMVIREGLTFPYVDGAEFVRWFDRNHPGEVPYGSRMPKSTEQILHPDHYASGDAPIRIRLSGDTAGVILDDTFGEFDIDLLRAALIHAANVQTDSALGWGGDRMRVYRSAAGPALVWVIAWDDQAGADRFRTRIGNLLTEMSRPGYRVTVEALPVEGKPGTRVVVAPAAWAGWKALPKP
ncbi:MAG: DUF6782 family putative metallopeptidase [Gemmatimonadales bacterium]